MTARKLRPPRGTLVTPDMSMRDIAACLGTSTAALSRYKQLAAIPEAEFERRLEAWVNRSDYARGPRNPSIALLRDPADRVPARGRVQRAFALYRGMTEAERRRFLAMIAERPL